MCAQHLLGVPAADHLRDLIVNTLCGVAGKSFWPPRLVVAQLLHAALAIATPLQLAAVRGSALRMWLEMALSAQLQVC